MNQIVRKLIGAVAKEAPTLERGVAASIRRATVNIGLDIPGGGRLAPEEALAVLERMGVKPVRATLHQSDTEPTLVVELPRSLKPEEAHAVSAALQQEAIAQVDEAGNGDLFGPMADKWKPFNGDYFLTGDGKRLTQQIMDAGDPSAVPGGEQAFAGGGLVEKAAKMLLGAADNVAEAAPKPMRLYHGRAFREPIKRLDPTISPNQLGIHLGDPETASRFAPIRPDVKVKDAGGRVIPLDVDLKKPLRLQDTGGDWKPDAVYRQLADLGLVKFDDLVNDSLHLRSKGYVQDAHGEWIDDGSEEAMLDAMLEVQDMIRGAGYDGVVYTNRYEMPHELYKRASERGIDRLKMNSMTEEEFKKEFPEAVDSYIAFRNEQLKSPFGEGPGVGFADGGRVGYEGGGRVGAAYKIGKGLVDLLDFGGVTGKPKTVKIPGRGEFAAAPIKELDAAAESYMTRNGIPGTHRIGAYPEFDEEFARRIANEFDGLKHAPSDPAVKRTYDALLDETMAQYKALEDTGLDIRFLKDGMDDPYGRSPSMGYADIVDNGRLWVFPTSQGYGSGAEVLEHPLLKKVGRVGDLEDATANDAFRVVHDAYGHFGPGNPFFRAPGEDRAWQHHARMYSDEALPAMSAETRGQNSWVNSGPHALANKGKSGADTIYADQKAVAMPSWVYERDLGRKIRGYADGGPVWSEDQIASMTHDQSYGTGREMNYLETLGEEVPLGEMNYFDVDGERQKPGGVQGLHDVARIGAYFVPGGAGPAAALDAVEAVATGDPTSALMAAAFGPGGRLVRGIGAGVASQGIDPDDAEAGMYGRLSKWGKSKEGKKLYAEAQSMFNHGFSNDEIRKQTNWAMDNDGRWKYELPSAGGTADIKLLKRGELGEVYYDPHLFEQHPELEKFPVLRTRNEGGGYNSARGHIAVGDLSKPFYNTPEIGGFKGVLDHEIYHKKADMHDWATGANKDQAYDYVTQDMRRFLGSRGDPRKLVAGQTIEALDPENRWSVAAGRYWNEIGEVLARREALRRDYTKELIEAYPPEKHLDVNPAAIFNRDEYATPEQYLNLFYQLNNGKK